MRKNIEVIIEKKSPNHKCLIVGSDGVWEIMPVQVITSVCARYFETMNSQAAADELVEKATNKWRAVSFFWFVKNKESELQR